MSERMIPLKIADMAVAACNEEIAKLQAENVRLKAEVERLRKAGDWMREALEEGPIDYQCRIDRWNAAKEGKPTIGLLSPREHWELSNGKSVGSDDTWESYCQRMHADIARWVHAVKEGKQS